MIDAAVTAIALVAVLIARLPVARMAARSAIARRLRTLYSLAAALLALRLATPLGAAGVPGVALMIVAAWLPFAALRLAEELCRRHARRVVKLLALGGAVAFTLLAVTLGLVWSAGALLALAAWQAAMLALMVAQMARARRDLAVHERRTLDAFLLALLLTIPLALSDFTALLPDARLRGGAIAVLVLVLGSSRLADDRGTPAGLLADLAVAGAAGGTFAAIAGVPTLPLAAAGAALAALLLLIERTRERAAQGSGLVAALARVRGGDVAAILSAHPLLDGARLLEGEAFAAYPPASVARLLDHPVVTADAAEPETRDAAEPETRDAARELLLATQATHLLRVSRDPPRLLAVAAGGLAGRALDDELVLAARLIEGAA